MALRHLGRAAEALALINNGLRVREHLLVDQTRLSVWHLHAAEASLACMWPECARTYIDKCIRGCNRASQAMGITHRAFYVQAYLCMCFGDWGLDEFGDYSHAEVYATKALHSIEYLGGRGGSGEGPMSRASSAAQYHKAEDSQTFRRSSSAECLLLLAMVLQRRGRYQDAKYRLKEALGRIDLPPADDDFSEDQRAVHCSGIQCSLHYRIGVLLIEWQAPPFEPTDGVRIDPLAIDHLREALRIQREFDCYWPKAAQVRVGSRLSSGGGELASMLAEGGAQRRQPEWNPCWEMAMYSGAAAALILGSEDGARRLQLARDEACARHVEKSLVADLEMVAAKFEKEEVHLTAQEQASYLATPELLRRRARALAAGDTKPIGDVRERR